MALGTGFAGWAMKAGIALGIPVFLETTTDTLGDLTVSSLTATARYEVNKLQVNNAAGCKTLFPDHL